jgi:hypothetical protein
MTMRRKSLRQALAARAIDRIDQLPYHRAGLGAKGAHDIDELDDAEPSLTAFVLGDERLRLGQALCHLRLRQTLALAEIPQQGTQLLLARRAQSVAHGGRPRSKTAASPHNPSSGLSHFGIMVGLPWRNARSGCQLDRGEGVR